LRPGTPADAGQSGRICYEAFRAIALHHNFPPDFPSPEVAAGLTGMLLSHPGFYSVVAEADGMMLGTNFLDERSKIAGVGPITVDPEVQNAGVGRTLMLDVMGRARERGFPGIRLLQAAYHTRSLSLYAKLGFHSRESIAVIQGDPVVEEIPGYTVRTATAEDLVSCNALCVRVHGHDRAGELEDAVRQGSARVVEHDGRVSGYTTGIAFVAHAVGESNEELKALIGSADEYVGPGFLVPIRNSELFRWCLRRGLRVVQLMTLMTVGLYQEPAGAWMPSILY